MLSEKFPEKAGSQPEKQSLLEASFLGLWVHHGMLSDSLLKML
jgi:hypothetical protein